MKLGSFCTGYGGLDLAVGQVFDAQHMWHAEIDSAASAVLAAHWPDVPNHGDLTAVDWSSVEPVDILTAGFPCQPVSAAGQRRGLDDERWLFDEIADAVGRMVTRPRLLVCENVPGLLTANGGHAMARVVHRLAALGYVGRYRSVRASDVGAAHRRERVFIIAHLADPDCNAVRQQPVPVPRGGGTTLARGSGAGAGVLTLLPTPRASDGEKGGPNQRGSSGDVMLPAAVQPERWGAYGAAVARWEHVTGRPAPDPTEPGAKGQPRLSPRFVEWLMGLPAGWATDHLPRNPALRVLGNGVVPQQAAYAVADLAGVVS